ncbi:MAG: hypothetical protein QNJ35_04730 [Paracoccaceae bacterium]|nr:hypothetical protein [Paracoccaceae bacterium]
MKLIALTTALAVAAAAPAFANNDQLARSLGVEPGVLTTSQLVQIKSAIESDDDNGNRYAKALIERFTGGVVSTMSTGVSAGHAQLAAQFGVDPADVSASELAVIKGAVESENDSGNRQVDALIERFTGGVVSTMSSGISTGHAQLAASLDLDPNEYSVAELAAIKFAYDSTNPTN